MTETNDDEQSGYLETALKQVFARDDVRDFRLVQAVGDGRGPESGVQGHDCQIQIQLSWSVISSALL